MPFTERTGMASTARRYLTSGGMLVMFALLLVVFSLIERATFPTTGNITSMLQDQAPTLMLAVAVLVPLRAGDFDLSVSAVMIISDVLVGMLTIEHHVPLGLAIVIAIVVGAVIGLINAIAIVGFGIDSFIVTLGMQTMLTGVAYAITSNNVLTGIPSALNTLSNSHVFNISAFVIAGWVIAVMLWLFLRFTPFGYQLLFTGGNRDVARLTGVPINRVRTISLVLSATLSSVAGIFLLGYLGSADPSLGPQYLLAPFAAAFLGATIIQPGRFNVVGTVAAVYFLVVGITGLELLGAANWVSEVFDGGALIAAVLIGKFSSPEAHAMFSWRRRSMVPTLPDAEDSTNDELQV